MSAIKVRFAPSPTGNLHVGNLRTALVNYLFACKFDGHFMLRIDDTDEDRSTAAFEASIRADLGWMGMTCLLYTSPSPRDLSTSRMPSSA